MGSEDSAGGSEESSDDEGESHTVLSNKTYTYDSNGNQLRESDSITNEVKCYTYDATNRMDKELRNQKMVNQLSTITKTTQYFTQLEKLILQQN